MNTSVKIILTVVFLFVNGLYSSAAAENSYEHRIQKLEELLEIYFDENRVLKKKIIELEKRPNSSTNQTAAVTTTKTARDRCEANLQICSKVDLCELSTYKIGSKPRDWKVGVYRKFVTEAKRRGLTCGVKTVNSSTNQTAAVTTTKTARDRCEANLQICSKVDLCELSTYKIGSKPRDWKVGVYRKFVTEAKRRGLTCGVKTVNSSTNQTAAVTTTKTARDRCEANLQICSKVDLCELSTYKIGSKPRDWKVGVYRKFVTEAKRRGLTCGVKTVNSSTNQTAAVTTTKTARDSCEADLAVCNEAVLCDLATYGPLGNKNWKVENYTNFIEEAARRNINCGVSITAITALAEITSKEVVSEKTQDIVAEIVRSNAREICDANLAECRTVELCDLATFGMAGATEWKIGSYTKFVDEAKRRGLTCGVKTVNSSTNQTAAVTSTKTDTKISFADAKKVIDDVVLSYSTPEKYFNKITNLSELAAEMEWMIKVFTLVDLEQQKYKDTEIGVYISNTVKKTSANHFKASFEYMLFQHQILFEYYSNGIVQMEAEMSGVVDDLLSSLFGGLGGITGVSRKDEIYKKIGTTLYLQGNGFALGAKANFRLAAREGVPQAAFKLEEMNARFLNYVEPPAANAINPQTYETPKFNTLPMPDPMNLNRYKDF